MPSVAWKARLGSETPVSLWLAFFLLCGLSSSAWILPSTLFATVTTPQSQTAMLAAGGFLALLAGGRPKLPVEVFAPVAGLGILLLALPFILSDQARTVNDVTQVAIFAMVPIEMVILMTMDQNEHGSNKFLLSTVAALGGLLFVLPVELPPGFHAAQSIAMVLAAAGSVAFASARLPAYVRVVSFRSVVVLVCLPSSLLLFLYVVVVTSPHRFSLTPGTLWSGALNLLELGLLLRLVQTMPPLRLAARFIAIPLLTTVEGYLVLRGPLTVRVVFGMLVATSSAAYLLFAPPAARR